jgi:NCAIR mutase (PurE)-related protein
VHPDRLKLLLAQVAGGDTSVEAALEALRSLPFADLGDARVDHHRELRTGMPEVVYAAGKTTLQLVRILAGIAERGQTALATRVSEAQAAAAVEAIEGMAHDPVARTLLKRAPDASAPSGPAVCIVTAGTSDVPVAEEAAVTAGALGHPVERIYDVGVAGLHRIASVRAQLQQAAAVIGSR